MKRLIYLDHNSTTPVRPDVLEAMRPYFVERYGNASSLHAHGRIAREAVEAARDQVANAIGARADEIVFTSGGTESDNFALRGTLEAHRGTGRSRLVTTAIEHHAIIETAAALERQGFPVTFVPVDQVGRVDSDALRRAVTEDTALVSVMHANNEVGTIQPIAEAARLAHERGALFHTDAVQTVGKVPLDVESSGVDLLSLSAHKFGGPKGVGALYIRRGTRIERLMYGGAHERGRRGGTENVPGIVGMGVAIERAITEMRAESERLRALVRAFLARLDERIDGYHVNTPEESVPGTVSVTFEGAEGESLILGFDLEGICLSTGSACTSGSMEPSHVLAAMGLPDDLARGTLRFSFGRSNRDEDVDAVIDVLARLLVRVRRTSVERARRHES